ncbi:hypothetical protein [Rhizobium laguerreae]|uniref:hypothetical protein n=1 Tax=Rhizobium laguerreae TaxID=1076926 RepID=UPI001C905514|nr:hypothetical protein [Rhizobium laguerreae]MBY3363748.1 hypothetical protein [Rhizobium laguerreae]
MTEPVMLSPDDFLDGFDHDYKFLEIDGKAVKLRPMTSTEIFEAAKRIPKFRLFVQESVEIMFADSEASAAAAWARLVNPETLSEIFFEAGKEAVACFAACCMGRPHDEVFEQKLMSRPDEILFPLVARCVDITFGGRDPKDFFLEKLRYLKMAGIQKLGKQKPAAAANRPPKKKSCKAA